MVTRKRAVAHTIEVCRRLRSAVDIPVSLLIAPTVLKRQDLTDFKDAGADMIGVAIDLATPELFDRYRGRGGVNGPHQWDRYRECLADAIAIFGEWNAGPHFMVGMGEIEEEMAGAIQGVRDMGGRTRPWATCRPRPWLSIAASSLPGTLSIIGALPKGGFLTPPKERSWTSASIGRF
jgi:lipoyl synthase